MADDKEEEATEEPKGGGKKKILMGVGALLALGGVYNFVLKPAPEVVMVEAMAEPELVEGEILELPEMVLNLSGEGGGYLRIGLALVLEEGTAAADMEAETAIAKDVFVEYLSAQNREDLADAEFRKQAKDDLSVMVREAYGDEKVVRVLFTTLVTQ